METLQLTARKRFSMNPAIESKLKGEVCMVEFCDWAKHDN